MIGLYWKNPRRIKTCTDVPSSRSLQLRAPSKLKTLPAGHGLPP